MEAIYFAPITCLITGFIIGKYHERFQWSNLIHQGKLPKPTGK